VDAHIERNVHEVKHHTSLAFKQTLGYVANNSAHLSRLHI